MASEVKAQIGLQDTIVKDEELEQLLEKRQELKETAKGFRAADKKARVKIGTIQTPMPYRVGRFIISASVIPPKSVAFDTGEATRLSIKTVDEG